MLMQDIGKFLPCAMSVASSDSGAGAGIQADILTFASLGVYGTTAIAALTSQNPKKVSHIEVCSAQSMYEQLLAIEEFYKPKAAKCGMLFDLEHIEAAAKFFTLHRHIKLVVDPVFISSSGAKLIKDDALNALAKELLPLADVITPNLDEAKTLLNCAAISKPEMMSKAKELSQKFSCNVLLKGGHLADAELVDVLFCKGLEPEEFFAKKISDINTHGSGCTLSAAICAYLAKGLELKPACLAAHTYLQSAMQNPIFVGGENFINHFPKPR